MKLSRDYVISELKRWSFPTSERETEIALHIAENLRVETITRYTPEQLAWMKMKQNACFQNSYFMEKNDPEGKTRVVHGWMPDEGGEAYVRHAVIRNDHGLFCVTPMAVDFGPTMQFIVDPDLGTTEDHTGFTYRGEPFKWPGIRCNPEHTLAQNTLRIRHLRIGASIKKVMQRDYGDK